LRSGDEMSKQFMSRRTRHIESAATNDVGLCPDGQRLAHGRLMFVCIRNTSDVAKKDFKDRAFFSFAGSVCGLSMSYEKIHGFFTALESSRLS
jgi:hypothetical protein